ncbi:hypothetical protein [Paenibacillus pinistramenti]|nr:hypothetical protein [Paenibacillus pinistramenti]
MSTKRKPPTLHQKKEEVNKKALIWLGSILGAIVVFFAVILILVNS